jgi:Zn-dependent protease
LQSAARAAIVPEGRVNLSPEEIRLIVIRVFVLVASVAFHEFGHAFMADRLGDDTPRRQGRVTLNPLAHADPIGTLLLPVLSAAYGGGGFGWGRPVQWQPARINRKHKMSTARILVAVAGPMMNVVLAVLITAIAAVLRWQGVIHYHDRVDSILWYAVYTNFILFFFNLIPAPPLDGGHVAEGLTPYRHRATFENYARFGPFILLAVIMIPQLAQIFIRPAIWCGDHLYRLFGM